jgi:hypothetical protein
VATEIKVFENHKPLRLQCELGCKRIPRDGFLFCRVVRFFPGKGFNGKDHRNSIDRVGVKTLVPPALKIAPLLSS